MPKKRTAAQVLDAAGSDHDLERHKVNGDRVRRDLEKGTKINYHNMLDVWDEYVTWLFIDK